MLRARSIDDECNSADATRVNSGTEMLKCGRIKSCAKLGEPDVGWRDDGNATMISEVDVVSAVVSWYWSCALKHLKALRAETFNKDGIEVLMPCFSEAEDVRSGGKPKLLDLVDLLVH